MKPTQISQVRIVGLTDQQRFEKLGPFARRHGHFAKGTVLPETRVSACPRVKVADFPKNIIPTKYIEGLEHNQKIPSCCRHPENHEIEGFKTHPEEPIPDFYVFYCTCGRKHYRHCVGETDDTPRPIWCGE